MRGPAILYFTITNILHPTHLACLNPNLLPRLLLLPCSTYWSNLWNYNDNNYWSVSTIDKLHVLIIYICLWKFLHPQRYVSDFKHFLLGQMQYFLCYLGWGVLKIGCEDLVMLWWCKYVVTEALVLFGWWTTTPKWLNRESNLTPFDYQADALTSLQCCFIHTHTHLHAHTHYVMRSAKEAFSWLRVLGNL